MPTLPRDAEDPEARRRALEQARETYRYDRSYADVGFAAEIPRRDRFDLRYLAKAAQGKLLVGSNCAASRLSEWLEDEWEEARENLRELFDRAEPDELAKLSAEADNTVNRRVDPKHPLSIEDHGDMFPLLPDPSSMTYWAEDWYFAWQRIAGCNPHLIERVTALPDHFPVTDALLARSRPDDSLAAAIAEGRLYMLDYAMLQGVPLGTTEGRQKYLDAPLSLYLRRRDGGLVPVAIQIGQTPGPDNPIYTPADGIAWAMAKTSVQIADANHQGVVAHFGFCHLIMEAVILTTRRQLAAEHPLRILLEPHFEYTLPVNRVAREQLVNPNGNMDRLQSGTLEGSLALTLRELDRRAFCETDAPTDFAKRGVDDLDGLPSYPCRDDSLSSWAPLLAFVRSYVELYYQSAEQVRADVELQAWVRELGDRDGGRIHRVTPSGAVEHVDELVMLIARILYTCTIFHASVNYSSYDFLSFAPNMPGAGWGPSPRPGVPATDEAHRLMMTPVNLGFELISLMHSISVRHNRLGEYPRRHFDDPRVEPLVEQFQRGLAAAETVVVERNAARPVVYPYLVPSNITASIHV